jgi:hypothetical protein
MRFAILFWTISGCETKSAGLYSIVDRATQHPASAQQSIPQEHRDNNAPARWDSARFLKLFLSYERFPFAGFSLPSRR